MRLHYPGFAVASTIVSNLIPMLAFLTWQWSVVSILFLYWLEGVWLMYVGLFYILFVIRFDEQNKSRFTLILTIVFKIIFGLILLLSLTLTLSFLLWLIGFSAIFWYEPRFQFARIYDWQGNFSQLYYTFSHIFPNHLLHEPTIIIGLIGIVGNYLYLMHSSHLGLGKTIDQMDLTWRFMSGIVALLMLSGLSFWFVYDKHNEQARTWVYFAILISIFLKMLYELRIFTKKAHSS